jgi:hypothetical protein
VKYEWNVILKVLLIFYEKSVNVNLKILYHSMLIFGSLFDQTITLSSKCCKYGVLKKEVMCTHMHKVFSGILEKICPNNKM